MRYNSDLVEQISEELAKIPLIRHVCAKFAIDHSTFSRWMVNHPTFEKKVHAALYIGRANTNGAAESVILQGVQKGDFRSASFWLSHNDLRYMQKEKGDNYAKWVRIENDIMKRGVLKDETTFEGMFELFYGMEEYLPFETIMIIAKPFVDLFCHDDKNLPDILYAAYEGWRNEKKRLSDLVEKADPSKMDNGQ